MKLTISYEELRRIVRIYATSKTIGMDVWECEYIQTREKVDGEERSVPVFEVEFKEKI